jgi:hypothetical protein
VTQPLLHEDVLYVGSLNHRLYAVEAATGRLLWEWEAPRGITTRPVMVAGLLIFGDTAGSIHALDLDTRKIVWTYDLGSTVIAHPLIHAGAIFVAGEKGEVAALPWHLGHYAWAAERLAASRHYDEAGNLWALAAFYHPQQETAHRTKAVEAWSRAGQWQKIAYYWLAQGRQDQAVQELLQAGDRLRLRARQRAVTLFWQAHIMAFRLHRYKLSQTAADFLTDLANLPQLRVEIRNVRQFIQYEPGKLTLRVENSGKVAAPGGIQFWLGGGLQEDASYFIPGEIVSGQMLNIPLTIIPTEKESVLVVEYRYATGRSDFPSLRGIIEIPISARPPRQKPVQIGDVQELHVTIAATTEEGVAIETGDVALFKSQGDIGDMHIEGDAGAVINRGGDIGDVSVDGDVSLIK